MSASGAFVEGDDTGAAKAEIVLQGEPCALNLPCLRRAAQLVRQLVALRETRGAERMALGQQAAGRVGYGLAAIGVVAVVDEAFRAAVGAQSKAFIGDQFVVRETIVQLDDVEIAGADAGG